MTINLIALTGPHGEIGNSDGSRPVFVGVEDSMRWFLDTVGDNIVICGRVTVDQMKRDGVNLGMLPYNMVVFTRKMGAPTPQVFLWSIQDAFPGKDIYVSGGLQTYQALSPFCENFYIRKTAVEGSPDLYLPSFFRPRGFLH